MEDVQRQSKWTQWREKAVHETQLNVDMIVFLFLLFLAYSQKTLQNR